MLEKVLGKILVSKLRAILLLETGFNTLHKIYFNRRVLPALERHNLMPTEILGGRESHSTLHVALEKNLLQMQQIKLSCYQ